MLLVNDYIQLVNKPYDDFPIDSTMLGKVINIQNNTIIVKYPMGNMMMSMDEFTKYFSKHIPENSNNEILNKTKPEFTNWETFIPDFDPKMETFSVYKTPIRYEYCTNGKVVKVRRRYDISKKSRDILTGRSSCSPSDTFDLQTGIRVAYDRCKQKEISKKLSDLNVKLNYYTLDIHTY